MFITSLTSTVIMSAECFAPRLLPKCITSSCHLFMKCSWYHMTLCGVILSTHFLQQSLNCKVDHAKPKCFAIPFSKKPFKESLTFNHTTFDAIVILAVSETGTCEYCCYVFTLTSNSLPLISTSCIYTSHNSNLSGLLGP